MTQVQDPVQAQPSWAEKFNTVEADLNAAISGARAAVVAEEQAASGVKAAEDRLITAKKAQADARDALSKAGKPVIDAADAIIDMATQIKTEFGG